MTKQQTKYRDFAGALTALKDGKMVRREAWFQSVQGIYLLTWCGCVYDIRCIREGSIDNDHWYAQANDFYAEDWVVVE